MGIEELETLVAEGIKAGLKGIELRKWVDGERDKLKAEREAVYEAQKVAQEMEKKMLMQQLAALEELKKRRAVGQSMVTYAAAPHINVEVTAASRRPTRFPTARLPLQSSQGGFRICLQKEIKEVVNDQDECSSDESSEEQTFIPQSSRTQPQTVEGHLPQSRLLPVDGPLPPSIKLEEAAADTGAASTQKMDTPLTTVSEKNGALTIELSDLQSKHPRRQPELPEQASEEHQPEHKFKMHFLTLGTANRKALLTNRRCRLPRRKISLPCLSKRRRLRFTPSNKTLRKIRSVWLPSQNWPRQVTFPTGQPIYLIHQTSQSYSRIHLTTTGHKDSKNWSVLQRLLYAKKETRGHCVSKRSDWFSMRQRRLKLHGQHCWKYRKKN